MSRIVLYIAASLDGYIADEDGGIEWLETFEDTYDAGEPGGSFEEFFEDVHCIVTGANTYEQVLGFEAWPYGNTPTIVSTTGSTPTRYVGYSGSQQISARSFPFDVQGLLSVRVRR